MPHQHAQRLKTTCFRGKHCHQAGNFFAWNNFAEFLRDTEVHQLLQTELEELIEQGKTDQHHRIELEFSRNIGWDSCVDKNVLSPDELGACETRPLNKHSCALFVKEGVMDAPITEILTMVVQMIHDIHWKFIIRTIYPGPDCGHLSGNLTEKHSLVFLSWANPGQLP